MTHTDGAADARAEDERPEPEPAGAGAGEPPPLDLRVAEVLEAGAHPNADRLLVLRIAVGAEERQIVAGLAGVYDPAELVGRRIVVVANLAPAKLRGEVSQGMLLAAHGEARVGLLFAPDAPPGTRLTAGGAEDRAVREITIQEFGERTLEARPDGVTLDGEPLEGARLVVDREAWGRVR